MVTANRVAGNTVAQYVNLIVNVLCGLYSVRLILSALGEVDYGIYDLIGGAISLLTFLNTSLLQTSVRYLTISVSKNDRDGIRKTFNDCFWLHFLLACLLVFLLETISFFLFDGFLNIPAERVYAAKWVYQCMIAILFFRVIATPFSALVVAHEKFVYSAILSIANSMAKLLIAFYLGITHGDKLVVYGILMATIGLLDLLCFILFLVVKYRKEIFVTKPSLSSMRGMFGFAGWTVFDTVGNVLSRQGYPILLNNFFGATINAAYGIARQVAGHVYMVSSACIETMKPQIIKSYGTNDIDRMLRLSMTAGKMGFILMSLITIPAFVMMPSIMELWLVSVPQGAVTFARLLIIVEMVEQITRGFSYACQAIGKIKWLSIFIASFRILGLPLSIVFLFLGYSVDTVLYLFILCEILASFSRVIITSKLSILKIKDFIKQVILYIIPPYLIALFFCYFFYNFHSGILWMMLSVIASAVVYLLINWLIGLTAFEKTSIREIIQSFIKKYSKGIQS